MRDFIDETKQIEIVGKMVEDIENFMRQEIEEIYFKKTKEVIILLVKLYRLLKVLVLIFRLLSKLTLTF